MVVIVARMRLRLPAKSKQTPPGEEPARWDWLRRYRTWEANRKVLLYPENSVEPEDGAKHDEAVRKRTDDES